MPIIEDVKFGDLSKGDPLPEAVYHMRVAKIEIRTPEPSKENPDPYQYVNIDYVVTGGSPEEYHGRHAYDFCTLEPGKNFALRRFVTAVMGEPDPDFSVLEAIKAGTFNDAELLIALGIEPAREDKKTGKKYDARNKVVKRLPLES